jgi:predicted RNase H-like HicB family nuclease
VKREFNVIIEKDAEGYYVATVPALKGCHTQAKSLDVLMERVKEAIELCLEEESSAIYPYDFVGVQKITINEPSVSYTDSTTKKSIKKLLRTTPHSASMAKLHIVRDNKGRLINAKTHNQARAVDLKKQNKKEKRK